jgi:HME family heavy-metal exporter
MFNAIIHASLRQRLLVLGLALILVLYGGLAAVKTPVDVFPDLNKPMVTLMTEAGGMAPEEVEQLVTFPIESAMNGMSGVTRVRSMSGIGLSVIYVEFDWGSDVYINRQQVAERLNLVRGQLPPGIEAHIGPISSIMGEVLLLALPADPAKIDPMQVREYADWVVRPRLLTVPGVAQVIPIGGEVRQFRVTPDPARLLAAGVSIAQLKDALDNFSHNSAGGFVDAGGREYLIRNLGQTSRQEDLAKLPVTTRNGQVIRLHQVAEVGYAAALKRGDAGYNGQPAVILSVQKQPAMDTVKLTRQIETVVADLSRSLPTGVEAPRFLFRQAEFIERSVSNVEQALRDGAIMVAAILFLFLANFRTTFISLTAIPVSLLAAVLAFQYLGLSINTMTLGGLAIAIGELVDDAVVDVENVLRRLRENRRLQQPRSALAVVAAASTEVRSGVVYATLIVVLVFVPLFALPGIEGRLFTPLGIAYIISILASMLVAMTVTPVLCYYLLPHMKHLDHGDSRLVAWLKRQDEKLLHWSFDRSQGLLTAALVAIVVAAGSLALMPRSFLPPFNEGTLTVNVLLNPGTALAESNRIGAQVERLLLTVPEVSQVGRRTGRAELDEHAEGIHYGELDVDLKPSARSRDAVIADIRQRLATLPAAVSIGQPISHRLDHLLSGVRAQIALKLYGDDLDTLRAQAAALRERLAKIRGIADLQIEKQVLIPQFKVRVDHDAASRHGLSAGLLVAELERLLQGENVSHVIEGSRRFDISMRLPESARRGEGLARLLIETPTGTVPLAHLAAIEEDVGPNQIGRGKRPPPHRHRRQHRWFGHGQDRRRDPRGDRRAATAGRLFHRAGRPVPGAGTGGAADCRTGNPFATDDLPGALFSLSLRRAGRYCPGKHSARAGRCGHRAVDIRSAAVGRGAGRLCHADRDRRPQWHSQDQPLHQSVRLRRRALWPPDDRARLARTPDAGADDCPGGCLRPDPLAGRRRRAREGDPPSGSGRHFWRTGQLDASRYPADSHHVLALGPACA